MTDRKKCYRKCKHFNANAINHPLGGHDRCTVTRHDTRAGATCWPYWRETARRLQERLDALHDDEGLT